MFEQVPNYNPRLKHISSLRIALFRMNIYTYLMKQNIPDQTPANDKHTQVEIDMITIDNNGCSIFTQVIGLAGVHFVAWSFFSSRSHASSIW